MPEEGLEVAQKNLFRETPASGSARRAREAVPSFTYQDVAAWSTREGCLQTARRYVPSTPGRQLEPRAAAGQRLGVFWSPEQPEWVSTILGISRGQKWVAAGLVVCRAPGGLRSLGYRGRLELPSGSA